MNYTTVKRTEGYNYERIEYEGTTMGIWDLSGHEDVDFLFILHRFNNIYIVPVFDKYFL